MICVYEVITGVCTILAPEIVKLVNNSIMNNIFPNDLKYAEVPSLSKKEDALSKLN